MKKIINYFRFANKKRAISPVIAVILLIGLAVAAAAAIFLIVLPLLQPSPKPGMNWALVEYDDGLTKALDIGKGYGIGTVALSNAGTGGYEVTSIKIYYALTPTGTDGWTEITDAVSAENISKNNPYPVNPVTDEVKFYVGFPIPDDNDDNVVYYRMVVEIKGEKELDTAKEAEVVTQEDIKIEKDRPDISFTGSLDYVRREQTIFPTSASDNSEIKNVTYEVSTDSGFGTINRSKTITDPGVANRHPWNWDTFIDSAEGLDNGTYYLRMTVYDYAGLSKTVDAGSFIIDNDYVSPTIGGLWITDPYPNNQTAEVGQSISFTVEITDSGTEEVGASQVNSAILYYRLDGSVEEYETANMNEFGTTNNWTANIDPSFVDSAALENGIECYISAADSDENTANTSGNLKIIPVDDHIKPDISHTAVETASSDDLFINITATITDKDQVNETTVKLYYRQTDDYGGNTTSWVSLSPSISGSEYSWLIWSTDITIHGLDYFFNATDRFSGQVANAGIETSPNHIDIPDESPPIITHTPHTTATNDTSLVVECIIYDSDPTFGADPVSSTPGTVTLYYRDLYDEIGGANYGSTPMTRISGNSSIDNNYETPSPTVWSGTIPALYVNNYDTDPSQLDYYILAIDASTNPVQHGDPWHEVSVLPQGDPVISFVPDSITVSGSYGEQIYFEILNKFGSGTSAEVTKLNLTILSDTADFSSDFPKLNMTDFNGTQVWADPIGITNKTWTTQFSSPYPIDEGFAAGITMTFENDSNKPYSMYNLNLILELEVNNSFDTQYIKKLTDIDVPSGQIIELRYMTSSYTLSTQGTTNPTQQNTPWHYQTAPTVQWGIRVFIGAYQITSALEATVSGTSSWSEQQGKWTPSQKYTLNPTDSITISVRVLIGGSEYTLADFSTGALGARELMDVEWTINYWVYYNYRTFGPDRTQAYFGFGDNSLPNSHDSFVANFTYLPA